MRFFIETELEVDGRWIAEVIDLPGTLVYGKSKEEAITKVQALALRVLADQIEHNEARGESVSIDLAIAV